MRRVLIASLALAAGCDSAPEDPLAEIRPHIEFRLQYQAEDAGPADEKGFVPLDTYLVGSVVNNSGKHLEEVTIAVRQSQIKDGGVLRISLGEMAPGASVDVNEFAFEGAYQTTKPMPPDVTLESAKIRP